RGRLDVYAAGVNAFLATKPVLPIEFLILRDSPDPWRPDDTLIWDRLMALQLAGNWRDELLRARLAPTLPPEFVAALWPNRPADTATTLTNLASLYGALHLDRTLAALPPPLGPDRASNEWVVAGEHTVSGKPLLVNDPHLALNAPGTWYLARLDAPGLSVTGATAPGVPGVILGHNDRIAWGFTTTGADMYDVFIERVDPADPSRYLTPDGAQPFETRTETIKVRGQPDVQFTARSTRHGPVISDAMGDGATGEVLALAYPAVYREDTTPAALFEMNHARDWGSFVAALSAWHAPMQNMVYADVDGNIGFIAPGLLPRRKAGDGWLPRPGWTGEYDWEGFVPFAELPRAFNPVSGRIVNANNRVVGDNYPVFITRDWAGSHRAKRIYELLDATARHDRFTAEAMQADIVSTAARDVRERLGSVKSNDDASRRALALLTAWDGDMRRDRPEPLIFNAWMRELTLELLHDGGKYDLTNLLGERSNLVLNAMDGISPFCRDRPAGCAGVVSDSLQMALSDLSKRLSGDLAYWRWDSLHYAAFRHPVFERIPVLRDIFGFRVPTDGDFYTVNRAATSLSDAANPFADVHGPGYRAIYDLSNLDDSRFIAAPGQSGNPLSRHWGDMVEAWANGRDLAISDDPATYAAGSETLTLLPQ
ncbi:MAG TPA: penicillin acylase family protein, partial [Alphaproteobacteria bacterium]